MDLSGLRAFCPFSQIALHRVDDPSEFLGQSMEFKILELSDDNRNIVVSRRAILERQRESVGAVTRASLAVGDEREGTVTRLMPFGAFVCILLGLDFALIAVIRLSNPPGRHLG